jgi:hypothetical protein
MKTEIVIARYNENLDWLKKIKKSKDLKITVYNKGTADIDVPFIPLPNIGRESHTYLYHIIKNYNNLADQTIFCQGDSIFHSPGFLDLVNKHRKKFEPVQPLTAFYWPEGEAPHFLSNPPLPILEKTKDLWFDKKSPIHVEYMDNNFATLYPFHYIENDFILLNNKIKSSYGIDNPLKFNVERFRLKNVDLDYLFPVSYAAIFSVNKEAILDNSVDYYNNIMSILIYDIRNYYINKKMDHGLILEKLWLVIFNYKKYNKNYLSLKVKDFILENYNIRIKNNEAKFSYFNIYFQLFISITIDETTYNAFISPRSIYLKMKNDFKMLYNFDSKLDSSIYKLLKDNTQNNISIELKNNILKITINKNVFIDYNFNNIKHKNLKSITVYDMAKYNNFEDNLKK